MWICTVCMYDVYGIGVVPNVVVMGKVRVGI